jgi:hypothetical protein
MGAPENDRRVPAVTTRTDDAGHYQLDKVHVGPEVVSFEHPAHVFKQEIDVVGQGEAHELDVSLLSRRAPHHFDVDEGGVVQEGFVRVQFPPESLVYEDDHTPVHGEVMVTVTPIDPRVPGDIDGAPARLEGITANGNGTALRSYGMVEVELTQDERTVQVRPGEHVRVDFSVEGMPNIAGGDTIPMWHHDRTSGYWRQERDTDGLVHKTADGTLAVTAMLPHFSSWNVDSPSGSICTQFMLRRVVGAVSFFPQTVKVRATNNSWSMTPLQRDIDRGDPSLSCSPPSLPACDRAKVFTFNAPKGAYGSNEQYYIEALNFGESTASPLLVRYPSGSSYTESTTILSSDIDSYIDASAGGQEVGNWCGPLPSANYPFWVANDVDLTQLVGATESILQGNFSAGTVFGTTLDQYRLRFTYALRPSGTSFVEGAAQAAQDLALANPIANDADQDGVDDATDNCTMRPNPSQNDSNNNGIGDACENYCYVPPTLPDAAWYDMDGDGIDDWCDNNPFQTNGTQLENIVYDM